MNHTENRQKGFVTVLFVLVLALLLTAAMLLARTVVSGTGKTGKKVTQTVSKKHKKTAKKSKAAAVVQITNMLTFSPKTVTIHQGETVHWDNISMIVHTVTADPKLATMKESVKLPKGAKTFNSGNLDHGETFEHTFTVPGTYRYFCIPHEAAKMRGEVIVLPKKKKK